MAGETTKNPRRLPLFQQEVLDSMQAGGAPFPQSPHPFMTGLDRGLQSLLNHPEAGGYRDYPAGNAPEGYNQLPYNPFGPQGGGNFNQMPYNLALDANFQQPGAPGPTANAPVDPSQVSNVQPAEGTQALQNALQQLQPPQVMPQDPMAMQQQMPQQLPPQAQGMMDPMMGSQQQGMQQGGMQGGGMDPALMQAAQGPYSRGPIGRLSDYLQSQDPHQLALAGASFVNSMQQGSVEPALKFAQGQHAMRLKQQQVDEQAKHRKAIQDYTIQQAEDKKYQQQQNDIFKTVQLIENAGAVSNELYKRVPPEDQDNPQIMRKVGMQIIGEQRERDKIWGDISVYIKSKAGFGDLTTEHFLKNYDGPDKEAMTERVGGFISAINTMKKEEAAQDEDKREYQRLLNARLKQQIANQEDPSIEREFKAAESRFDAADKAYRLLLSEASGVKSQMFMLEGAGGLLDDAQAKLAEREYWLAEMGRINGKSRQDRVARMGGSTTTTQPAEPTEESYLIGEDEVSFADEFILE